MRCSAISWRNWCWVCNPRCYAVLASWQALLSTCGLPQGLRQGLCPTGQIPRPIADATFKPVFVAGKECPHSILIVWQIAAQCLTKSIGQRLVVPNDVFSLLLWVMPSPIYQFAYYRRRTTGLCRQPLYVSGQQVNRQACCRTCLVVRGWWWNPKVFSLALQ